MALAIDLEGEISRLLRVDAKYQRERAMDFVVELLRRRSEYWLLRGEPARAAALQGFELEIQEAFRQWQQEKG